MEKTTELSSKKRIVKAFFTGELDANAGRPTAENRFLGEYRASYRRGFVAGRKARSLNTSKHSAQPVTALAA